MNYPAIITYGIPGFLLWFTLMWALRRLGWVTYYDDANRVIFVLSVLVLVLFVVYRRVTRRRVPVNSGGTTRYMEELEGVGE